MSPKAYELLKLLLEQRPKALSKAELHERLWPGTFVSEVNLAALVNEVRAALGERGRHGRFIRTVHGFGYAFAHEAVTDGDDGTAGGPRSPAGARAWSAGCRGERATTRCGPARRRSGATSTRMCASTRCRSRGRTPA